MKNKLSKIAISALVLGLTIQHLQAMECEYTPFPLEALPEGVPSMVLSFATHNLEIKERCQFDLVSKQFTEVLNSLEGHEKWDLVKLWKLISVKGVFGLIAGKDFSVLGTSKLSARIMRR